MKYSICLAVMLAAFSLTSKAQVEQDTWLIGGNGSFRTGKNESISTTQSKERSIIINPNIGYFIIPKLATGIRMSYETNRSSRIGASLITKIKSYGVGPFIRYYILKEENPINLLVEANYKYQNIKFGSIADDDESNISYYTTSRNSFEISAGPVFYFNSSVGLETLVSYNNTTTKDFSGHDYFIQFSLGLQIHLQKK